MTTPTPHRAMPELLPCPFCHSTDVSIYPPTCSKSTPYNPADRAFPVARCKGCGASKDGRDWDQSGKSAIAAWNRRAAIRRETHIIEPPDFDRRPGVTDGMYPDDLWQYACLVGYRYKLSEHDREQSAQAAIQQAAGAVREGTRIDLTQLYRRAKVYSSIAASPHHMTFTIEALRNLIEEFASPAIEPPKQQPDHLAACAGGGVKVRELVEELEIAAGRITQYSNSPLDGLLQAAADALRDFAAAPSPRRVPLTADQLYANDDLMALNACHGLPMLAIIEVVRTIERAHGIGPAPLQGKEADHAG